MCENNTIAFFKQPCTNLIGITVLAGDSYGLCRAVFLVLYMHKLRRIVVMRGSALNNERKTAETGSVSVSVVFIINQLLKGANAS